MLGRCLFTLNGRCSNSDRGGPGIPFQPSGCQRNIVEQKSVSTAGSSVLLFGAEGDAAFLCKYPQNRILLQNGDILLTAKVLPSSSPLGRPQRLLCSHCSPFARWCWKPAELEGVWRFLLLLAQIGGFAGRIHKASLPSTIFAAAAAAATAASSTDGAAVTAGRLVVVTVPGKVTPVCQYTYHAGAFVREPDGIACPCSCAAAPP